MSAFEDGDGVRVEIDLVPLPDVRRIVFTGELGLPEDALREAVVERFGSSPAISRAADIARALEELLAGRRLPPREGRGRARGMPPRRAATSCSTSPPAPRARCRTVSVPGRRPRRTPGTSRRGCRSTTGSFFDRAELRRRLDAVVERWRARRYYEARADAEVEESESGDAVGRDDHVRPRPAGDGVGPRQRPHGEAARRVRAGGARRLGRRGPPGGLGGAHRGVPARAGVPGTLTPPTSGWIDGDQLRIVFTVRYGPLYRVAGVRFEGADAR
ncbi:MAG: hypothetical protein MZV64_13775 [Ignavibacteriales bacterium]|nr:hypothetical protein [Ignavibacteriales bacterium]